MIPCEMFPTAASPLQLHKRACPWEIMVQGGSAYESAGRSPNTSVQWTLNMLS